MTTRSLRLPMVTGFACVVWMGAASVAAANTIQFEAESARDAFRGGITSPMMIKDDPAASGGSYIAVAAGNKSPSGAPASSSEGVAKYRFSVTDTATYRIWARVSAPTDGDDSFWVRMGASGSWIKWNGIPLGTAYHWVLIKAEGASSPATFNLTADVDNQLQVAYREDGTRLDALYITSDTAFDPRAPLTVPPAPPVMQPAVTGGAAKISWSAVPGATSYTLEVRTGGCTFNPETQCCDPDADYVPIATGLTVHRFISATGGQFRVTAVAPTGTSFHPVPASPDCFPFDPSESFSDAGPFEIRTTIDLLSVTSPMQFFSDFGVGAPAGTDSMSSPPAHGRARLDFELAAPTTIRMWANVFAPNKDQDSFWVRYDDGTWIKWNNLDGCETFYDSGKSGEPIVRPVLGAGSHRIEWAYREGGARLSLGDIVFKADRPDLVGPQCSD